MKYHTYKKIIWGVSTFAVLVGSGAVLNSLVISYVEINDNKKLSSVYSSIEQDFTNHKNEDKKEDDSRESSGELLINSVGLFDREVERIEKSLDVMEGSLEFVDSGVDDVYKTNTYPKEILKKEKTKKDIDEIKTKIRKQSKDLLILIKEKKDEKIRNYKESNNLKFKISEKEILDTEKNEFIEDDTVKRKGENNENDEKIELNYFEDYNIKDLEAEFDGIFNDLFDIEKKTVREIIELEKIVIKKKKVAERVEMQSESLLSILRDSDKDGISDYDEIHIYETDPNSMDTDGDGYFDGVEIIIGFNPTDDLNVAIEYENPKQSEIAVSDEILILEEIKVIERDIICTDKDCEGLDDRAVVFSGKALPNTFVTLYIFSIPTVVTVKTDSDGNWNYVLDKELEDGDHEIYVAMTDSSGKIIAKNSPTSFNKQAAAITVGKKLTSATIENEAPSFFNDSFIYITLLIVLLAIGTVLVFSGGMRSRDNEIDNDTLV